MKVRVRLMSIILHLLFVQLRRRAENSIFHLSKLITESVIVDNAKVVCERVQILRDRLGIASPMQFRLFNHAACQVTAMHKTRTATNHGPRCVASCHRCVSAKQHTNKVAFVRVTRPQFCFIAKQRCESRILLLTVDRSLAIFNGTPEKRRGKNDFSRNKT